MKSRPDPSSVPQTEGHPEAFPDVTTLPKGWDMSGLSANQTTPAETSVEARISLRLDVTAAVEDGLA